MGKLIELYNHGTGVGIGKIDLTKKTCSFCEKFDFSRARPSVDEDGAKIEIAICNTHFPIEEQFNYCPICSRKLKDGVE